MCACPFSCSGLSQQNSCARLPSCDITACGICSRRCHCACRSLGGRGGGHNVHHIIAPQRAAQHRTALSTALTCSVQRCSPTEGTKDACQQAGCQGSSKLASLTASCLAQHSSCQNSGRLALLTASCLASTAQPAAAAARAQHSSGRLGPDLQRAPVPHHGLDGVCRHSAGE